MIVTQGKLKARLLSYHGCGRVYSVRGLVPCVWQTQIYRSRAQTKNHIIGIYMESALARPKAIPLLLARLRVILNAQRTRHEDRRGATLSPWCTGGSPSG